MKVNMDSSMTFRIDSRIKEQMTEICAQLGMTPSTAINLFVNAFVREKGMPFQVKLNPAERQITREEMLTDTDILLHSFASDYERMAK